MPAAVARLLAGRWIYERVGYDKRRMEFCPNGLIGEGAAAMEVFWNLRRVDGVLSLDIQSPAGLTCRLTPGPDGGWGGRWEEFERMPIELRPLPSPEAIGPAGVTEAVGRLTGTPHLYRRAGFDTRPMEFLSNGEIGTGRGGLETQWRVYRNDGRQNGASQNDGSQIDGDVLLEIGTEAGLTCRLKLGDGGIWRGRWESFGRMPVEVYPRFDPPEAVDAIDVVYTWVDGEASAALLQQTLRGESRPLLPGAATLNRYRSIGELRFSLRSLHLYAPWVRRVFLVTNGTIPPWLNTGCPKLRVVHHAEIFENPGAAPNFNSHAIELNLHRIPGLAPAFLYFNDDLFLGQPVGRDDFLSADGVQSIFFADWDIPREKTDQAHDRAYVFTLQLLDRVYGARPRKMLAHTPQLYRVDVLEEICRRWKAEIEATSANRFRTANDAVLRILYAYFLLESPVPRWTARRVVLAQGKEYAFAPISANHAYTRQGLSRAARDRPKFICLNDEIANAAESSVAIFDEVLEFLSRQYPDPSPFERDA